MARLNGNDLGAGVRWFSVISAACLPRAVQERKEIIVTIATEDDQSGQRGPAEAGSQYTRATEESRSGRATSLDALDALERAMAAPAPSRELSWRSDVIDALDVFLTALVDQSESDLGPNSLLSEIGRDHPRLVPRIQRLHQEHTDLRNLASSLRGQIEATRGDTASDVDPSDVRERLADLARRYRRHRSREADLVYESVTIDLGVGD